MAREADREAAAAAAGKKQLHRTSRRPRSRLQMHFDLTAKQHSVLLGSISELVAAQQCWRFHTCMFVLYHMHVNAIGGAPSAAAEPAAAALPPPGPPVSAAAEPLAAALPLPVVAAVAEDAAEAVPPAIQQLSPFDCRTPQEWCTRLLSFCNDLRDAVVVDVAVLMRRPPEKGTAASAGRLAETSWLGFGTCSWLISLRHAHAVYIQGNNRTRLHRWRGCRRRVWRRRRRRVWRRRRLEWTHSARLHSDDFRRRLWW